MLRASENGCFFLYKVNYLLDNLVKKVKDGIRLFIIKKFFRITAFSLMLLTLFGCNVQDEVNNPISVKDQILTNSTQQQYYSFEGTTSIDLVENDLEDVIRFNGFISENNNVYLDLSIASIEGMPEEKMEVIKLADKLKVKFSEEDVWQEVSENEYGLFSEFTSWNPEHIFELLKENADNVTNVKDENGRSGLLVNVNSDTIRKRIEEQLKAQLKEGGLTDKEKEEMKVILGLTDEEITEMEKELDKQIAETKLQIDEILSTMKVDAVYKVYYDPQNLLINEIYQNTKTVYTLEGERIEERTIINIKIFDYGKKHNIPTV